MEPGDLRILLVEDNPGDARLLRELLREVESFRFQLIQVERLEEARRRMETEGADVVLLDLSLPDAHGMETVTRMLASSPEAPIIVLTGLDDETVALQAVHAGAQDYLVKGQVESGVLARAIRYARERKRLERERAQLLEREREARATAERAVQARDEVLRVVAHDLGNSLSAVQVTARVLLRTLSEEGSEGKARRGVATIRTLAEQMQRLRQDLLDVALLDAGHLVVTKRDVSPGALVDDAVERYRALAEERSVSLEGRVPEDLPPVSADAERLQQVLTNLITNAIKFTPPDGRITVGAEPAGEVVRFLVRDTGPGIAEEDLPHIFDRFWTRKAGNPHGAGLGLAIAKGLVDAHGGTMAVESARGAGTTFSFTLPTASAGSTGR